MKVEDFLTEEVELERGASPEMFDGYRERAAEIAAVVWEKSTAV